MQLNDLTRLEDDALYSAGMEIVQQILEEMASIGRTKTPHTPEATVGTAKIEVQINYTGINALLAVEECGDLGGYTRCQ